jgi:hypothetical protein
MTPIPRSARLLWVIGLGCVLALSALRALSAPAAASASHAEEGPTWTQLTAAQQQALRPLQQRWADKSAQRKAKWLQVAERFPALPAQERQRVQARMTEWAAMTPAERGRARQRFQELRKLPAADRQALWEAYRALPDRQRGELARRAKPAPLAASAASSPSATPPAAAGKTARKPRALAVKPIAPTVVQTEPGATTRLVTKLADPPPSSGRPKVGNVTEPVNRATLLPWRGPQPASPASSASPAPAGPQP